MLVACNADMLVTCNAANVYKEAAALSKSLSAAALIHFDP